MTTATHPAGLAAAPPGAEPGARRWRGPAMLVAVILLTGLVVALLQVKPPVAGVLDPDGTGPAGAHAVVALLTARGQTVLRAGTVPDAVAQAGHGPATLVVTSPSRLDGGDLAMLARVRASLLLVAPGRAALAVLAPQVTRAGPAPVRRTSPGCGLPAARLAGAAALGGALLRVTTPGAWRCYTQRAAAGGSAPALIQYASPGRLVTVLGSGSALSNRELATAGDAALALNLLRTPRVVWLVPGPRPVATAPGHRSLASLVPAPVYAVALQLGIVVLLTALWRMRRLGPLVAEPLPAVVRACETVQGHGRLYRSRRARDRAAAALREAALRRITAQLGLPRGTSAEAASQELAGRTGRGADEIQAILSGPVPGDDAALVRLATDLDTLEGQVTQ